MIIVLNAGMEGVTTIGLISDTHGVLEEETIHALKSATEVIIHAGDVGDGRRKSRYSAEQVINMIADRTKKQVVAVSGNVDEGYVDLPPSVVMTVAGKKVLVVHICGFPPNVLPETKKLVDAVSPDIVVFGHSHIPGACCFNDILYINPGSAGPRRFKLPRCLSFLSIHSCGKLEVSFAAATSLPRDVAGLPPSLIKSGNICESLKDSEILPESVLG